MSFVERLKCLAVTNEMGRKRTGALRTEIESRNMSVCVRFVFVFCLGTLIDDNKG